MVYFLSSLSKKWKIRDMISDSKLELDIIMEDKNKNFQNESSAIKLGRIQHKVGPN